MLDVPLPNYNLLYYHHPCRANSFFICTHDRYRDAQGLVGMLTLDDDDDDDDDANVNKAVILRSSSQFIQISGKTVKLAYLEI
jgi:hypothetical protein